MLPEKLPPEIGRLANLDILVCTNNRYIAFFLDSKRLFVFLTSFRKKLDDAAARNGQSVVVVARRRHSQQHSVHLSLSFVVSLSHILPLVSVLPPEIGEIESLKKIDLSLNPVIGERLFGL